MNCDKPSQFNLYKVEKVYLVPKGAAGLSCKSPMAGAMCYKSELQEFYGWCHSATGLSPRTAKSCGWYHFTTGVSSKNPVENVTLKQDLTPRVL
ncbi:hypothetical protein RRG08_042323 [Elysia crispata]|uniref:Uncharacterized protein n=1 Tax=Elysia crispata TaxID=231223 RepID=A0AAE0ZKE9_9GAST|nr:hypothetical protein RRG08_042323 [Elysia crispata]